jgi:hypothetical protein
MEVTIRRPRLATPSAPLSLAEKRSQLDELRTQAMFSDSDLLSRRIRDLEAQIEQESGRRAGERRAVTNGPLRARLGPRRLHEHPAGRG